MKAGVTFAQLVMTKLPSRHGGLRTPGRAAASLKLWPAHQFAMLRIANP